MIQGGGGVAAHAQGDGPAWRRVQALLVMIQEDSGGVAVHAQGDERSAEV